MKCETGPVDRQFGGTNWVVYSCDDQRSMVVVSVKDNPASPFYFILSPKADSYDVYGEGNGSKSASDAAGGELSRLSIEELRQLLAATRTGGAERH
jgi:hypothetical protein